MRIDVKANRIAKGWGKYCSNDCKSLSFRRGNTFQCQSCGKKIYKSLKDQSRSKSGNFFCNKSCQAHWRNRLFSGSRHNNWKNGEHSYRESLKRANIKQQCVKCRTSDDRILAVHHKDKNRQNNDLSNLIWLCHNCHFLVHHYSDEAIGFIQD
jgi:hypothetical protein